jgi:hypothetical protein
VKCAWVASRASNARHNFAFRFDVSIADWSTVLRLQGTLVHLGCAKDTAKGRVRWGLIADHGVIAD